MSFLNRLFDMDDESSYMFWIFLVIGVVILLVPQGDTSKKFLKKWIADKMI